MRMVLLIIFALLATSRVHGFAGVLLMDPPRSTTRPPFRGRYLLGASPSTIIDFQSDSSQYGRGEMHLSAVLEEGDVVAYQTGTWFVDGVAVGDDDMPATLNYCRIETMQIVWSHNCEHGVLRGMELKYDKETNTLEMTGSNNVVEFGPEQLIARFPVEWKDDDDCSCTPLVELDEKAWIVAD